MDYMKDNKEISAEEAVILWQASRLSLSKSYEKAPEILKVHGSVIGTLGNFSASIGKAKSKKTFNVSAIVAAALKNGTVLRYVAELPEAKRKILYVDTEQSPYHCLKVMKRILRMAGLPDDRDNEHLEFLALRKYTPEQRIRIVEQAIYNTPDIALVIIDGIRDMVYDINSPGESTRIISKLMQWTDDRQIHIHTILHQNKGDENARGHIGTELNNKAETVLLVEKDKSNGDISNVSAMHIRAMDFEPFAFHINDNALPELMEGYTPEKKGRVKYARFFMFNTKEELPFEVQYLTAADELSFYSNVNAFLKDLTTGEYITKLTQLRRLTISAYGLVSLDKNFTALKNLEYLDLSSNNFQKVPEEINPTNFPKLRTLNMGANTRKNIYDLSNTIETNYGGLVEEQGFPRRLIEWDLDTLLLSVNYLQGPLPKMDDWEKYTEQDIIDADTLPRALIGTPKVMPHTKRFAINLTRLPGELPDWLLYHPALDWWVPSVLVFTQEGKDATGTLAGFTNEPANMNYYYEFYEGYKKDPGTEEEEETTK